MAISYALVTGANQGIGYEIVRGLGKIGFTPILGCRSISKAQEAARRLSSEDELKVEIVELDVTSDKSILAARDAVEILCRTNSGSLDLLVNNAAILGDPSLPIRQYFAMVYETNVTSVAIMMDTFIPILQKSTHPAGGHIINVASTRGSLTMSAAGTQAPSTIHPYSTSKAAENLLSIDYARTWEGKVRINAVCPGHCSTNLNGHRGHKSPEDGAKVVLQVASDPYVGTAGYYQLEGTEKYTPAPL